MKAFKAVLLHRHVQFPFTHDLEELVAVFEGAGTPRPHDLQEAGSLTPYAVETRYPGYWGEISGNSPDPAAHERANYARVLQSWRRSSRGDSPRFQLG